MKEGRKPTKKAGIIKVRTLILGDVHGGYRGMMQVFKRSKFDYIKDKLIVLGDICDGWPEVKQCIDELFKVKNLIYIIGNHDEWTLEWMTKKRELIWESQGGQATFNSYVPQSHIEFLKNAYLWHKEGNDVFVHGGIDPNKSMDKQEKDVCLWDRSLIDIARYKHFQKPKYKYGGFDNIFIGHTTTLSFHSIEPLHYCNIWNLDTGGGWGGKITIIDLDTKKFWQSDFVKDLYPESSGRR